MYCITVACTWKILCENFTSENMVRSFGYSMNPVSSIPIYTAHLKLTQDFV